MDGLSDIVNTFYTKKIKSFLFIGYQLACIQCTSPTRSPSENWDYSCLDGTLTPVLCEQTINGSKVPYKNCISALYRLKITGNSGRNLNFI